MTTDRMFIELIEDQKSFIMLSIPNRDKKILLNLFSLVNSDKFITKNQANLLVKILKENYIKLNISNDHVQNFLDSPTWSKPFRIVQICKKIYTLKDNFYEFFVEFSFNAKIKQVLLETQNKCEFEFRQKSNTLYSISLTEKNLYTVIKVLKPFNFEISENLQNFYQEIEIILENKEFYIKKIEENKKYLKDLEDEIGYENLENEDFLLDRRFRFGYTFSPLNIPRNLQDLIVNREKPKIWINSNKENFDQIIETIINLKRFPILFIMDQHNYDLCSRNLVKIHESLISYGKNCDVYFRLDSGQGSKFNQYINENSLNKRLEKNTDSVIISNTKLPKFFLSSDWYPRSVISFSNAFTNNKTSVWCNAVDLIIYYTDKQPIISETHAIL